IIRIASCFMFNESDELLLLQRHSEDLGGGLWGTPGGRLEEKEDAKKAVLREIYEETGLQLEDVAELGAHEVRMPHGVVNMTSFKARVPNTVAIRIDPEEHHAHAWFRLDGLLDEAGILWGIPTILHDFGLFPEFAEDPTLSDGSQAILLKLGKSSLDL
ncbi:MAG: NUDIX hydrolase, partial [Patescibacteria group bacterium]